MAIANQDQLINDSSVNNRMQNIIIDKITTNSISGGWASTLWLGTGMPSAGTTPTVGLAGAVTTSSATAGALPLTAPGGGRSLYLAAIELLNSGIGEVYLLDRLCHANITNDQATGAFSPVLDATARLATGEGAVILMEVTTALSAGTNTRTFTYTNQDGTGGKTTADIITTGSAAAGRIPYGESIFVPLAAGDTGVRSIESTTLSSGTATGAYNVALCRVIAKITLSGTSAVGRGKDYILDLPNAPVINSSSCLFFAAVRNASGNAGIFGFVRVIET